MNRKRCYHIVVGVMIMAFLTGCGIAKKSSYKKDSFHRIYLITDRSLTYPQTGKKVPVQKEETGHLRYGKVDVENEIGDVLTDFYYKDSVFEARIPWGLLGFSAPSVKEINNIKDNATLTVSGINIGYLSENEDLGEKLFSWDKSL